MADYKVYVCDICGKEQKEPHLLNIVINEYKRTTYQQRKEEHYCCDFDVCNECAEKYRLGHYKRVKENIEFLKENYNFLSKIRKFVKGFKEDRIKD